MSCDDVSSYMAMALLQKDMIAKYRCHPEWLYYWRTNLVFAIASVVGPLLQFRNLESSLTWSRLARCRYVVGDSCKGYNKTTDLRPNG